MDPTTNAWSGRPPFHQTAAAAAGRAGIRSRVMLGFIAALIGAALASQTHAASAAAGADLVGQVAGYSADVANEEGYWYSRYSMMTLTMQSGLGTTIPMDAALMSMMQQMMTAVGATPDDPVMPPVNPRLLLTIRAGGDPHYVSEPNQADFATLAWAGGPSTLTTEATAMTIAKELEWAKLFHRNEHFGQAQVDRFGSTQRFVGMLLAAMPKMQLQAYLAARAAYRNSKLGDYAMLLALSDGAALYSAADQANTQGPTAAPPTYPRENRYADPVAAAMFARLAQARAQQVLASEPESARELSMAIQSVVWYAAIATDRHERLRLRQALLHWGEQLRRAEAHDPAARAYQIRGLIEVGRVTGTGHLLNDAAASFRSMLTGFDPVHGVLRGTHTLTIDDVAAITGAFNAGRLWLGTRIDQVAARGDFGKWWEGSVDLSGLEISSPAVGDMKAAYELLDPPGRGSANQPQLNYRYPAVALPQDAGGLHGIAPVFAASVTIGIDGWTADRDHFDTAGAMHAANEMIWFHSDEINGFPDVHLP